jgi:hypothetical protein
LAAFLRYRPARLAMRTATFTPETRSCYTGPTWVAPSSNLGTPEEKGKPS